MLKIIVSFTAIGQKGDRTILQKWKRIRAVMMIYVR